jgi:carbonic anhydrase
VRLSPDIAPQTRRRFVAGMAGLPLAWGASRWRDPGVAAAEYDYEATPVVPADQGLQQLIAGNQRFVAGALTALDDLTADRAEVADGQSPFAVIVCCSDSRAPLLVVLGHSGCGAVEAAIAALQGDPIPGYAYRFAEAIGPAVQQVQDEPGDLLDNAIRANIELGVERLRTAEPDLAPAMASGTLTIAGGYYDLASGEVSFLP